MKKVIYLLLLLVGFQFLPLVSHAQVEGLFVERYYVSDSIDATDTTGGGLEAGSVTYRVFVDLKSNSKLIKVYGDSLHPLKFSSTEKFFNNLADGQTFGKDFTRNRLQENTVALDSWITIGQTTRTASKTYFGVPKAWDDDGSFIGGINNDGGSAAISNGLLVNEDPFAGIPLTTADGMDTMSSVPLNWISYGFLDQFTGVDSTIFGSVNPQNDFQCFNCGLQNIGTNGVNPDSNYVLIAQLTTKGDLSFRLNLVVEEPGTPSNLQVKYVAAFASGEQNSDTLKLSPFLTYPALCGCKDPNYLEYSEIYSCNVPDSCRNLIRYGCMDTLACNYDPSANFHISQLCCYPGYCNDRDIAVVCPSLNYGKIKNGQLMTLYPVPASDVLHLEYFTNEEKVFYSIRDVMGNEIYSVDKGTVSGLSIETFDIQSLPSGIYLLKMSIGDKEILKKWMKY